MPDKEGSSDAAHRSRVSTPRAIWVSTPSGRSSIVGGEDILQPKRHRIKAGLGSTKLARLPFRIPRSVTSVAVIGHIWERPGRCRRRNGAVLGSGGRGRANGGWPHSHPGRGFSGEAGRSLGPWEQRVHRSECDRRGAASIAKSVHATTACQRSNNVPCTIVLLRRSGEERDQPYPGHKGSGSAHLGTADN